MMGRKEEEPSGIFPTIDHPTHDQPQQESTQVKIQCVERVTVTTFVYYGFSRDAIKTIAKNSLGYAKQLGKAVRFS